MDATVPATSPTGTARETPVGALQAGAADFSEGATVLVEQADAKNWMVCEPFSYRAHYDTFRRR